MTQLNDLKRACQEKLAHKKGDLYGREQLRADMDYSFAATPDKILALISSHEQLQSKLDKACEALEEIAKPVDLDSSILNRPLDNMTCALEALDEIRKKDE